MIAWAQKLEAGSATLPGESLDDDMTHPLKPLNIGNSFSSDQDSVTVWSVSALQMCRDGCETVRLWSEDRWQHS